MGYYPCMKTAPVLLLCGFIVICSAAAFAEEINWRRNLDQAMEEARESGRPVLIDFWASWCAPCRSMDSQLWQSREGTQLAEKFVYVRIDFDNAGSAVRKFHVTSVPTVVFTDSHGNLLTRIIGFDGVDNHLRIMKLLPADYKRVDSWNEILSRDAGNPDALSAMGRFYYESGVYDVSNQYYEKVLNRPDLAPAQRSEVALAIGWNYLKLRDFNSAYKSFDQCLENKEMSNRDAALFGMVVSSIGLKKKKDAQKAFHELQTAFPDSRAVEQARRLLTQE